MNLRTLLDATVAAYAGLLAIPLARAGMGSAPGPAAYAGVFVGVSVVVLAGARSARELDAALDRRRALFVFLPPVAAFAWFVHRAVDAAAVVPAYGVGALAAIPAGVALVVAHEIRLRERTDSATEYARFEARPSPRSRKVLFGGYAALVGALVLVGGALVVLSGADEVSTLVPALGGTAGALPAITNEREVRITDEGLRVSRVFHDWDCVTGYEVTEDALVLRRAGWRRPLRFDREDIEDFEAVDRALGRHLPRDLQAGSEVFGGQP